MPKSQSLTEVLDELLKETENSDEATVADILDSFDSRSYGPILLLPSIFLISPLGAIPTVPTVFALLILTISLQLAAGRSSPWIPNTIKERGVSRDKLTDATEKIKPWAEWFEKFTKPRISILTEPPAPQIIGVLTSLLALLIPPLELIPFAVFIPGAGIALLSLALTSKDGALAIIGVLCATATVTTSLYLL